MSIFLGLVSVAATVAVAFFTWKLTAATEKMAELQQEMTGLQKTLGEKQEQLAELQRTLAEAEIRPLLVLRASTERASMDTLSVRLENLGRFGVLVLKLKEHRNKPAKPDSHGQAFADKDLFPLPLQASSGELVNIAGLDPNSRSFFEVVYQNGASGELLSDLWQFTGNELGFKRIWYARNVRDSKEQGA